MSVRYVAIVLAGAALAGCGIAKMAEIQDTATNAKAQYTLDTTDCTQKYPDRIARPASPRVACLGAAILKYHTSLSGSVGDPFIDLVTTMSSRAAAAAEAYDAGKKTPTQYELALATVNSEYQTSVLGRLRHPGLWTPAQAQASAAASDAGPPACTVLGNPTPCF